MTEQHRWFNRMAPGQRNMAVLPSYLSAESRIELQCRDTVIAFLNKKLEPWVAIKLWGGNGTDADAVEVNDMLEALTLASFCRAAWHVLMEHEYFNTPRWDAQLRAACEFHVDMVVEGDAELKSRLTDTAVLLTDC
jgi:hypothetical protein